MDLEVKTLMLELISVGYIYLSPKGLQKYVYSLGTIQHHAVTFYSILALAVTVQQKMFYLIITLHLTTTEFCMRKLNRDLPISE